MPKKELKADSKPRVVSPKARLEPSTSQMSRKGGEKKCRSGNVGDHASGSERIWEAAVNGLLGILLCVLLSGPGKFFSRWKSGSTIRYSTRFFIRNWLIRN